MYVFEGFVETARKNVGKEWPSDAHRVVAENICLNNPKITTMDGLMEMVDRVIKIPAEKIRTITHAELTD